MKNGSLAGGVATGVSGCEQINPRHGNVAGSTRAMPEPPMTVKRKALRKGMRGFPLEFEPGEPAWCVELLTKGELGGSPSLEEVRSIWQVVLRQVGGGDQLPQRYAAVEVRALFV